MREMAAMAMKPLSRRRVSMRASPKRLRRDRVRMAGAGAGRGAASTFSTGSSAFSELTAFRSGPAE